MWRGTIRTGQTVEVFPAELKARVRSLQVHGEKRSEASAGERVAVNLVGLEKSQVERGSWLSEPDALHNTFRLDVRLELLPSAPELEQRTRVHVHHGTEEVLARVNLLDRDTLLPGETCFAQLELESPLCPLAGDRVVLRFYSPVFTIGGGVVLDPDARKHKRFSESVTERLDALMSNDPGQVLLASMDQDNSPWPVARGAACLDVDESEVRKIMDPLLESGELLSLSEGLYISRSSWERLCVSLRAWLESNLEAEPAVWNNLFHVISFVIVFALAYAALMLLVNLINNMFRVPKLRGVDGLLGGILGIVRAYVIICIAVAALQIALKPLESEFVLDLLQESALGRFFTSGSALSDLFGIGANLRNLG